MGLLSHCLSLFSVETLDSRLTSAEDEGKAQKIRQRAQRSLWFTPEFYFYFLMFAIFVPLMFKAAYDISSPSNPNYPDFAKLLSPGWMGRPMDDTDDQYRGFREPFPMLVMLIIVHQISRAVLGRFSDVSRPRFDAGFGSLVLVGLHGTSFLKILVLLWINYKIAHLSPSKVLPLTWIFGIGMLFANELLLGYSFGFLSPALAFLDSDALRGVMPRWEVVFKCSMLRMVSYNSDFLAARAAYVATPPSTQAAAAALEKQQTERARLDTAHSLAEYSFVNYVGYVFYTPLFIAGPIVTFNDYMAQSKKPLPTINRRSITRYGLRFCISMLVMEFVLHFFYVQAIKSTDAWRGASPFQVSMVGFFNLVILWLKLMLPWRFFRLWSLIDGIDPPENMVRCVANNYSTLSFWRSWHRSFNRWVVRYLYVPLGGSKRPLLNTAVVFMFVALWHDIQLRLFIWGWLVVIFVVPELLATHLFKGARQSAWYRHLCAVGAVGNIWMMMIANLVGFAVGVDGIKSMLSDIVSTADGLKFVILCSSLLFVGSQVMFEVRQREMRNGIDLRC